MTKSKSPMLSNSSAASSAAGTSASQPPVSHTITLRRLDRPTVETVNEQFSHFHEFLTGSTDYLTLNNVEIVPAAVPERDDPFGMAEELREREELETLEINPGDLFHPTRGRPYSYLTGDWTNLGTDELFRARPGRDESPARRRIDRMPVLPHLPEHRDRYEPLGHPRDSIYTRWPSPIGSPPLIDPPLGRGSQPLDWSLLTSASNSLAEGAEAPPIDCQACRERLISPIFLTCGHAYCRDCLNRLVRIGTSNRASWPPRCCGGGAGLEVEAIQTHLDHGVLIRYVTMADEFNDRNPVYCANKACSRYFEQTRVQNTRDKFMACAECGTQTCTECKQSELDHIGVSNTECKKLEDLMSEVDQKLAKTKRWKQCPGCRNLVERIDGCSHISCQCGVDFCYDCGGRREAFATACPCTTRLNRQRRQIIAEAENVARRTMDRVRNPLHGPRRVRHGNDATSSGITTTPRAMSLANEPPGIQETNRLVGGDMLLTSARPQSTPRLGEARVNGGGRPETSPGRSASPRPIRTRPRYENSRPIFPAAPNQTPRTSLVIAPLPPTRNRQDLLRERDLATTMERIAAGPRNTPVERQQRDMEWRQFQMREMHRQAERFARSDALLRQASDSMTASNSGQTLAARRMPPEEQSGPYNIHVPQTGYEPAEPVEYVRRTPRTDMPWY